MRKFPVRVKPRLLARGLDEIIILVLFLPTLNQALQALDDGQGVLFFSWDMVLLFLATKIFYEALGAYWFGCTLGKYLLNLRVESMAGASAKISLSQSLLRTVAMKLSFFMSWGPYILSFSRYDRTHLVDWIAMTRVVEYSEEGVSYKFKIYRGISYGLFIVMTWYGLSSSFHKLNSLEFTPSGVVFYLPLNLEEVE